MKKCWDTDPKSRPSFDDIVDQLKKLMSSLDK
jgi:hypothetical protein